MRISIVFFAFVVFAIGCKHQGAISPQEQVVATPVAPKFELAGQWIASSDLLLPQDVEEPITIRSSGDGLFSIDVPEAEELEIELRTAPLGNQNEYAIAEVLASAGGKPWIRYLGIVARQGDTLSVWWIESKSLAKLMRADGYSAVIEHSAFGSKVFADSGDLLDCVAKHSRELIGKPVTLTRKPE